MEIEFDLATSLMIFGDKKHNFEIVLDENKTCIFYLFIYVFEIFEHPPKLKLERNEGGGVKSMVSLCSNLRRRSLVLVLYSCSPLDHTAMINGTVNV